MQQASPRPMRPQYHFFYGSTDTDKDSSTADLNNSNTGDNHSHRSSSIANEQESLFGESLVPTDNEEEAPNSSDFDFQQVLISNGDNNGMRHVVGGGSKHSPSINTARNGIRNGGFSSYQHLTNGNARTRNGNSENIVNSSWSRLRQSHPVVHLVGLVMCMVISMVVFGITV